MQNNIEIVSETEDNVTIRKNSDGDFRVVMFTDTHIKGDKKLDNMTVTYLVKNIKELKPDLVILGGDNVTYGFNKKRNVQLAELFESLEDAMIARDFPGMADVDSSLYLFCICLFTATDKFLKIRHVIVNYFQVSH